MAEDCSHTATMTSWKPLIWLITDIHIEKETGPYILLFYWIGMLLVSGNFNDIKYLTFIGPCITNIFPEYNQQDAVFHSLLISARRCTCFRLFFCPSSGAQNCTYSITYLLPAASLSGNILTMHRPMDVKQVPTSFCSIELECYWYQVILTT